MTAVSMPMPRGKERVMSAGLPRTLRILKLALALAGGALCVFGGAGTAAASAEGCTYTDFPHQYVCAYVHGKGLHVDTVDVIRGKLDGGSIRDYSATVTVQEPDGTSYWFWTPTYEEKHYGRVVLTLNIDTYFDDGSKICGSFYESGTLQDTACERIHK
jgi:hypothetical protein